MINGLEVIELVSHRDDRGFFREIFRFGEKSGKSGAAQLSHSLVKKGIVKGWHGHKVQSQWNYVVSGQIKVGLIDYRSNSSTYKRTLTLMLGDG